MHAFIDTYFFGIAVVQVETKNDRNNAFSRSRRCKQYLSCTVTVYKFNKALNTVADHMLTLKSQNKFE